MTDCPAKGGMTRCPLYIESHVGRGFGCVDDMAEQCMVRRGKMDFQLAVLDLARHGIAQAGMIESLQAAGGVQ